MSHNLGLDARNSKSPARSRSPAKAFLYDRDSVESKLFDNTASYEKSKWEKPKEPELYLRPWETGSHSPESAAERSWDDTPLTQKGSAWRQELVAVHEVPSHLTHVESKFREPRRPLPTAAEPDSHLEVLHSSRFEHVPSKLMLPTAAFINSTKEKHLSRGGSPSRIPSPVRHTPAAPAPPAAPATHGKYAHVPSKWQDHSTKAALEGQYKWKPADWDPATALEAGWDNSASIDHKKALIVGSNATSAVQAHAILVGGIDCSQLPVPPASRLYKNVKSKVLEPTANSVHAQWTGSSPNLKTQGPGSQLRAKSPGPGSQLRAKSPGPGSQLRAKSPGPGSQLRAKSPGPGCSPVTPGSAQGSRVISIDQLLNKPSPGGDKHTPAKHSSGYGQSHNSHGHSHRHSTGHSNGYGQSHDGHRHSNGSDHKGGQNKSHSGGGVISIEYLLGQTGPAAVRDHPQPQRGHHVASPPATTTPQGCSPQVRFQSPTKLKAPTAGPRSTSKAALPTPGPAPPSFASPSRLRPPSIVGAGTPGTAPCAPHAHGGHVKAAGGSAGASGQNTSSAAKVVTSSAATSTTPTGIPVRKNTKYDALPSRPMESTASSARSTKGKVSSSQSPGFAAGLNARKAEISTVARALPGQKRHDDAAPRLYDRLGTQRKTDNGTATGVARASFEPSQNRVGTAGGVSVSDVALSFSGSGNMGDIGVYDDFDVSSVNQEVDQNQGSNIDSAGTGSGRSFGALLMENGLEAWEMKSRLEEHTPEPEPESGLEAEVVGGGHGCGDSDPLHLVALEGLSAADVESIADILGNTDHTVFELRGFEDSDQVDAEAAVVATDAKEVEEEEAATAAAAKKAEEATAIAAAAAAEKAEEATATAAAAKKAEEEAATAAAAKKAEEEAATAAAAKKAEEEEEYAAIRAKHEAMAAARRAEQQAAAGKKEEEDAAAEMEAEILRQTRSEERAREEAVRVHDQLLAGFTLRKKLGSEKNFQTRFVWVDNQSGLFYWAKDAGQASRSKAKSIAVRGDDVLAVRQGVWTEEECALSIMMASTISIKGSSRNITGSQDASIDISFTPALSGSARIMKTQAQLLYNSLQKLV